MADLIAQGSRSFDRWRRKLVPEQVVLIGRAPETWAAAWDEKISRRHAELVYRGGKLLVKRFPAARNPIFVRGVDKSEFELKTGEHFVIGETSFTLTEDEVNVSMNAPRPVEERAFNSAELQRLRFRNADQRLDVLSRLPDVIAGATNEYELFLRLVNMLLAGVGRADAAAVVEVDPRAEQRPARVLHWDRRLSTGGDFQPSQRLIVEALTVKKQSVLHVWGGEREQAAYTESENFDWAFCTPVRGPTSTWGIYVTGRFAKTGGATPQTPSDPHDVRDDMKFTELVAAILTSLLHIRRLQREQTALSQFFSPVVMGTLSGEDPERMLTPREAEVSVLFCDLRGFSRQSEKSSGNLMDLLERVSKALGVMTHHILDQSGVIGDFQGDAAMGFWGWPIANEKRVEAACLAALGIRAEFEAAAKEPGHPLADFRMGIGIATGVAVAGKIGTVDQGKVTVFGPVVNLASRLEGMTKLLQAPILIDETTAERARGRLSPEQGRLRRVACVKPYGLDASLTVTELLPPVAQFPTLTDQNVADYEAAVDALQQGHWNEAFQRLHRVPPDDLVKDFLTVFIAQHNRTPPSNWNGVIPLSSKS